MNPATTPAHSLTTTKNFTWRPAHREDLPKMQQIFISAKEIDNAESVPTLAQMEHIFDMLGEHSDSNTHLAITAEGQVAAMAFTFPTPNEDEHIVQIDGHVHADYRNQGLGTHLMQWAKASAQKYMQSFADDKPRMLITSTMKRHQDRIELYEQQGFHPTRYAYTMSRDLQEPIPDKPLPQGLTAVPYTPDLNIPMMNAFNTAFAEHWGLYTMTPDHWQRRFTDTPHFRPDLTYLAIDEQGQIAGFCLSEVHEDRNQQRGRKEGWMEAIGVLPQWRKKGVASALIMMAMRQYKDVGMETAALDVDTQNPTGALDLYQQLGFTVSQCKIAFTKNIS